MTPATTLEISAPKAEKQRVLYLGTLSGTSLQRANALERLGHDVTAIDPRYLLPATSWVDRLTWKVGGTMFAPMLAGKLTGRLRGQQFDLCLVDLGEWVTPGVITTLRGHAPIIVNYNVDDPLGKRDGRRFIAYRHAVPFYDLMVVVRDINVEEAKALGAKLAIHVWRSADEVEHAPRIITDDDREKWFSDVLFLGTWMPERGPFLLELLERGVPLTIRGSNWSKAPEWSLLEPYWKGGAIDGDDYAKAVQCARINLGLLSKGNRDLHTSRSLEVPSLGALLCAERTVEHCALYKEGEEAVFWSTAEECAEKCKDLLADETKRATIAAAGRQRLLSSGHLNEPTFAHVLATALAS